MLPGSSMVLAGAPNPAFLPTAFNVSANATIDGATLNAAAGVVSDTGDVVVEGGATVTALQTSVDVFGSGTGTLTLTGSLTTWHDITNAIAAGTGTFTTGGMFLSGIGAELIVSDAAALTEGGAATVGVGSSATIESGGVWTIGTGLNIGYQSDTTVAVLSGGTIDDTGSYDLIGGSSDETSTATVDGTGSMWDTSGLLTIGGSGTGDLTVSNDAVVSAASLVVGQQQGADGTLTIESGGIVDATGDGFGAIQVGAVAGSTGTVYVDAGSTLEVTGAADPNNYVLSIGQSGMSGSIAAASGAVYVSGTGALLTTNDNPASVGSSGTGALSVTDGATAQFGVSPDSSAADAALAVGRSSSSSGIVTHWRWK